ncbi:MAG: hypothetical protein J1F04_04585 [Oscillospiraceae bacterium]|nr:hypothetical protein [Oscillospiraceae bacterium]
MSASSEKVSRLLGDFFERNTAGDRDGIKAVIEEIEQNIRSGEVDDASFKDYFNNMYAGRGAVNTVNLAKDYPRESIIRELFQNIFGCDYDEKDIKVEVDFLDDGKVRLNYNEVGFRLEQVFYYLSIGRNDGDRKREGRFGLGAKSVFTNVDWFEMKSNSYRLRVVNDDGVLKVRDLQLSAEPFKNTEVMFALPINEQETLHNNLRTICSQKGSYINMIDLCFAFVRKKNLKANEDEECFERTFNIAIANYGRGEVVYRLFNNRKEGSDITKVRFLENGKSVADFIHSEHDGFTYIIPFAISNTKREAGRVLMSKYNYFSTFELTGFVGSDNKEFVDEQLSAFFVSVPNKYITNNRSGIKYDSLEECAAKIEKGILYVADEYKRLFVLELMPNPASEGHYMLRPRQYVFEFFYNYVTNSKIAKGLRDRFANSVSILFPHSEQPVSFGDMRKSGFFSERAGVTKEEHESGAVAQALYEDIEQMNGWYGKDDNHVLIAKYKWDVLGTDEGGEEFLYCFFQDGRQYFMPSYGNKKLKDYELGASFNSIISLKLNDCIVNGSVQDEDALAQAFEVIDEMFGGDYRISMKYFQFVVSSGAASISFEISKINIGNMKKAYDVLSAHESRFENHQIFNQVVTLMVNSFSNGKDTVTFLKEIKSQGGDVSLALDINKRYRFSVYGKQFMIPPTITNSELLEIVGDVYSLIESGLLNNRSFDFTYAPGRFTFDLAEIKEALPEAGSASDIQAKLDKIFVCDLGMDKIALLDANNKLMKIVGIDSSLEAADRDKTDKFIILRDGMPKPQYASFVEFLLTDMNQNRLFRLFSGTEEPNIILPDQLPYYFKPVPTLTRREFDFLRGKIRKIAKYEKTNDKAYRNYFARDVNAKLYGYGGVCPFCGYSTGVLNSFEVKRFSIGIMNGEKEQKFSFALYLCHNDASAAAGWIFDDVSIGGMSPFIWLDEISQTDTIPPEFMYCRVKYRKQVTYDICEPDKNGVTITETVYDGASETLDFVLSPMMAAKWYEDNFMNKPQTETSESEPEAEAEVEKKEDNNEEDAVEDVKPIGRDDEAPADGEEVEPVRPTTSNDNIGDIEM